MDEETRLVSVEQDPKRAAIAREFLGADPRATFLVADGADLISKWADEPIHFDLIFADAWPGKFDLLDTTLDLLAPGGIYVIDDLLMRVDWPDGHVQEVFELLRALDDREDLHLTRLTWSTGLVIAGKTTPPR